MNKADLVDIISVDAGMTKKDTEAIINATMAAIVKDLARGGKVHFRDFGTFSVRKSKARTGRNPKTNEPVSIPAKYRVNFKSGQGFADALAK